MTTFSGKVFLQQRVLPAYRVDFFETLAGKCEGGLIVFAGEPDQEEAVLQGKPLEKAERIRARNVRWLRGRFAIDLQPDLVHALQAADPDALILEANPRYVSNRSAMKWMADHGRPVLGWGLGLPGGERSVMSPRQSIRDRYVRRFQGLIAYSRQGAREYRAVGAPAERVFVAPNSVTKAPELMPTKHRQTAERVRLLFVGRLQPRKRVDLLMQACAAMDENLRPELVIVGDGPARRSLEELAQEIFPSAQFAGALEGQPLEQEFLGADLFVLPGTGGLAIQQAMAHALPIIAAEGDGSQRDLVQSENGWLVRPGDLSDLERVLAEALEQPERLRIMGEASFRAVQSSFNIDNMAAVFVDALHAVTEED